MKKLRLFSLGVPILLAMLLLLPSISFSQEYLKQSPSLSQTPLRVAKDMHEVRLSLGAVPFMQLVCDLRTLSWEKSLDSVDPLSANSIDYYYSNSIGTPAINLFYGYQLERWLNFGIVATYAGVYRNKYDLLSDNILEKEREYYYSFMPNIRFDWYRSNVVRLYSSIGLGLGVSGEISKNTTSGASYNTNYFIISFDSTPIGI